MLNPLLLEKALFADFALLIKAVVPFCQLSRSGEWQLLTYDQLKTHGVLEMLTNVFLLAIQLNNLSVNLKSLLRGNQVWID